MNRPKVVNLVLEDFGGDAEPIEKYIVDLEQERDQLKESLEIATGALHFYEYGGSNASKIAVDALHKLRQKAQEVD